MEEQAQLWEALCAADVSLLFQRLSILGSLCSLSALLLQREQLCAQLQGGDGEALPDPLPFRLAGVVLTVGVTGYAFVLAHRLWRDICDEGTPCQCRLARLTLCAAALSLCSAMIRLLVILTDCGTEDAAQEELEDVEEDLTA